MNHNIHSEINGQNGGVLACLVTWQKRKSLLRAA